MAENVRQQCNGNCMGCSIFQRQYCASQISYTNMNMISQLAQAMESLSHEVGDLMRKVESIQSNEGSLFNPIDDIAQEASGANNRLPRKSNP